MGNLVPVEGAPIPLTDPKKVVDFLSETWDICRQAVDNVIADSAFYVDRRESADVARVARGLLSGVREETGGAWRNKEADETRKKSEGGLRRRNRKQATDSLSC